MVWEHEIAMNTTRTTPRQALSRWQRGIAPALLLLGALAGMTLGSVAYAQITFRNASSATALVAPADPVASPGTTSTITYVGEARQPLIDNVSTNASTVAITPPSSIMAADDFVVVYVAAEAAASAITITNAAATGQAWTTGADTNLNGMRFRIFYCKYSGSWSANPTFSWGTSTQYQAWMVVFRGVDTTTAIDAGPNIAAFAAATNILIPANTLPTVTANAMVIASWHSVDNNTWALQTAGWSNPNNLTQWRHGGGSGGAAGSSSSIGYKVHAAGGSEAVTNLQSASDAGIRSILALRPAPTRLTINNPGTVSGDVLVASIGFRPFCCGQPATNTTITPLDSGWTALPRLNNEPSYSHQVYWKVAASEPAAYRWSFSSTSPTVFDAAAGGILKFSGVDLSDTNTPIITGVEESGRNTNAGDQTTPSITTTATDTMLVTSHSFGSGTTAAWGAPSGMTSPAAVDATVSGQATAIFYGVQAAVGATGQKRAFPTPDDDRGNAHILALRSATPGTALTIPIPSGTVSGDVMIAAITVRGADRSITPPSGWDEVRRMEQTAGTANLQVFYVRAADASDTPSSSYTWTLVAGNTGNVGGILSFSGVDTTAPIVTNAIDNHGGNLSPGTGGAITANSINTNVADTVAVSAHSFVSTANWAPPAGAVGEDVDLASRHVPRDDGISLAMYHYPAQTIPGATGDKTATASYGFDTGIAQILTLKPAPPPLPSAGGFNAYESSTAAGAITGVIKTKIAGSAISVDMIALNAAKTAIATTFTGTVRVEVLNTSNNSGALDGNSCRPTWSVIQTLSPDPVFIAGDNGRKTISFTQANSYPEARLRITYPAGAPTVTGCSTDNFAIRPNTFASYSVTDSNATTAGTTRTLNNVGVPGGLFHNAGQPFTVRATAVNAAGTPATTTNYIGTPTATLTNCAPAGNACTVAFGTFTLGASFAAGVLTSNAASYGDAGSFSLQLVDSAFSSVDAADGSTTAERNITSAVINVGRFVPDHFAVALNTPVFGTACGAGGFTYIGQPFSYTTQPVITVTAQNFTNGTTANYTGALWQITNTSLTGWSYTAASGTLNTSGITGTDPVIVDSGGGAGTLTFGSGTGVLFTRTTPVAPFNADVSVAINVIDADGVTYASNPARFSTATAGSGIAFSSGKSMRFGRLAIRNANGSQLVPLPVQVEAQYWSGAPTNAFITNTQDSCTSIAAADVAMSNFTNNLSGSPTCETAISGGGALSAGRRTLQLAAPGSANYGGVDLTVNISASASGTTCTTVGGAPVSATTADRLYLQGQWDAIDQGSDSLLYDDNLTARATFGVYRGSDEIIFIRENF
jgi:hypothetical protein